MASIPRDSLVKVPDCQDPDATLQGAQTLIFNSAFSIGGPACTVKTVEQNTDIAIDHFAVVNFEGFQAMVDALGGVDICVTEAVSDPKTKLNLDAGTHHLGGRDALRFVQSRKGFGDGSDIGRIGRQQAFLSAVAREATDSKLLLRPDRLLGFLDAATKSLTTDAELGSITALSDLALQAKNLKPEQINFVTVPNRAAASDPNRVEWTEDAEALWEAIRSDDPLPGTEPEPTASASATTPPAVVPTVSPDQLTVQVVNSSGVSGLAVQASAALAAQGFSISGRTNGTAGYCHRCGGPAPGRPGRRGRDAPGGLPRLGAGAGPVADERLRGRARRGRPVGRRGPEPRRHGASAGAAHRRHTGGLGLRVDAHPDLARGLGRDLHLSGRAALLRRSADGYPEPRWRRRRLVRFMAPAC